MPITVAQIIDKVSEGKSRVAILEGMRMYLSTNYIGSDQGPPEMTLTRGDYALVPQQHIQSFMQSLDETIKETRDEIHAWEKLLVVDGEVEQRNGRTGQKKKGKVTNERAATARRHPHHSSSDDSGPEGNGQLA